MHNITTTVSSTVSEEVYFNELRHQNISIEVSYYLFYAVSQKPSKIVSS